MGSYGALIKERKTKDKSHEGMRGDRGGAELANARNKADRSSLCEMSKPACLKTGPKAER